MASYADRPTFLANVLTILREVNEFSQADVAKRIGITRSAYSYYELGKSEPSSETLSMLSRMYAVPIETFFPPNENKSYFADSRSGAQNPQGSQISRPTNMGGLDYEERQLVALFRIADDDEKQKIIKILIANSEKKQKKKK